MSTSRYEETHLGDVGFNWLKDARLAPAAEDVEADIAVFIPVNVCCEPSAVNFAGLSRPFRSDIPPVPTCRNWRNNKRSCNQN